MIIWLAELRHRGIVVRALAIGVAVLLMFALAAPAVVRWGGSNALAAAGVAAGLCLAGAVMALAVGSLLRQSQMMMASLMLGIALRMGTPLAFGLAIHLHGGPLADAGLLYYLLMFYPVTLLVETFLSLPEKRGQNCFSAPGEQPAAMPLRPT